MHQCLAELVFLIGVAVVIARVATFNRLLLMKNDLLPSAIAYIFKNTLAQLIW
jgi:hypothetical protein